LRGIVHLNERYPAAATKKGQMSRGKPLYES